MDLNRNPPYIYLTNLISELSDFFKSKLQACYNLLLNKSNLKWMSIAQRVKIDRVRLFNFPNPLQRVM